jgi:hypothetical protein
MLAAWLRLRRRCAIDPRLFDGSLTLLVAQASVVDRRVLTLEENLAELGRAVGYIHQPLCPIPAPSCLAALGRLINDFPVVACVCACVFVCVLVLVFVP